MTFREYLRAQKRRNDPVGDVARDILADPNFPRRLTADRPSFWLAREYLQRLRVWNRGAVEEAFETAWGEWLTARRGGVVRRPGANP